MAQKELEQKEGETELIRVESETLSKVRLAVKETKQTIGGFYTYAAERYLAALEDQKKNNS